MILRPRPQHGQCEGEKKGGLAAAFGDLPVVLERVAQAHLDHAPEGAMGVGIVVQVSLSSRCQVIEHVEHGDVDPKLIVHQRRVVVEVNGEVLIDGLKISDRALIVVLTPVAPGHREAMRIPSQASEDATL